MINNTTIGQYIYIAGLNHSNVIMRGILREHITKVSSKGTTHTFNLDIAGNSRSYTQEHCFDTKVEAMIALLQTNGFEVKLSNIKEL
jgi:hypothetical protein